MQGRGAGSGPAPMGGGGRGDGADRTAPERRPALEHRPANGARPPIELHRSHRRQRGGQATLSDGRVIVRLPAGMDAAEEAAMVDRLLGKVLRDDAVARAGGDRALAARADRLADRYLDGVRATEVRWSSRMRHRLGSCTPSMGTIRISDRLARLPDYVLDYIVVHELAHLHVSAHNAAFHRLVDRYPRAERARGFLSGYEVGLAAAERPVLTDIEDQVD